MEKINSLLGYPPEHNRLNEDSSEDEERDFDEIFNKAYELFLNDKFEEALEKYSEMWKKLGEFEKISSMVTDTEKSLKQISSEVDSIKVKMTSFAGKKETEDVFKDVDKLAPKTDLEEDVEELSKIISGKPKAKKKK